jgi:hypothetical protein
MAGIRRITWMEGFIMKKSSIICITLTILIILGICDITSNVLTYLETDYTQPAGFVAGPRVKAAMKYHGINFAYTDKKGLLRFDRDGKKCRLFTKAFETYYNTLAPVVPQQSEGSVSGNLVAALPGNLMETK